MKEKFLTFAAAFAILFTAAVIGYNYLSEKFPVEKVAEDIPAAETTIKTTVRDTEEIAEQGEDVISCTVEDVLGIKLTETAAPSVDETFTEETAAETVLELQTADFTVYDKDGQPVKLSDFLNRPVVVNFWATWCIPCVEELPLFEELYKEYGDEAAFLMINVPMDGGSDEKVKKFVEENGYTFPVYYDSDFTAADAYGVWAVPQSLFITARGELAESHTGALSEEKLKEYFDLIYP